MAHMNYVPELDGFYGCMLFSPLTRCWVTSDCLAGMVTLQFSVHLSVLMRVSSLLTLCSLKLQSKGTLVLRSFCSVSRFFQGSTHFSKSKGIQHLQLSPAIRDTCCKWSRITWSWADHSDLSSAWPIDEGMLEPKGAEVLWTVDFWFSMCLKCVLLQLCMVQSKNNDVLGLIRLNVFLITFMFV